MDDRDFADMEIEGCDRLFDGLTDEPSCINEHCEFYDFMAHQNCGGDCNGEPAIASCKHSQNTEPPDTIESLRIRLAAAEQELGMWKGCHDNQFNRAEAAEQECDELRAERDRLAGEVERLNASVELWEKRWYAQGEMLSKLGYEQTTTAQAIITELATQLTLSQQSVKEQFVTLEKIKDILTMGHTIREREAFTLASAAIREAAKEGSK